ncbi:MAG: cytochrome c family protein [Pseudomonadota bacterium]
MTKFSTLIAAAVLAAGFSGSALAQDAAAGEKVFRKCKACHVVDKEQNRVGPHLVGIVGRPVGAVEGYKYSKAMTAWGEGKAWDAETLASYLEAPKKVVKGTKMAFAGLKKEADRANVIAYLESAGATN